MQQHLQRFSGKLPIITAQGPKPVWETKLILQHCMGTRHSRRCTNKCLHNCTVECNFQIDSLRSILQTSVYSRQNMLSSRFLSQVAQLCVSTIISYYAHVSHITKKQPSPLSRVYCCAAASSQLPIQLHQLAYVACAKIAHADDFLRVVLVCDVTFD